MYYPPLIEPQQLCPAGCEFDGDKEVRCLCGREAKLKEIKLLWTFPAGNEKERGWYACCSQGCLTLHVSEGEA